MATLINLLWKQPTKRPTISAPIPNYGQDSFASKDNYHHDPEKYGQTLHKSNQNHILPPRPQTLPQRRHLLYIYITLILLSLTAISLFSIAIPQWNKNFIHLQSPIKFDWPDALILIPLILSLISSIYLLVIWFTYRQTRSNIPEPFNLIALSSTLIFASIPTTIIVSSNSLAHAFSSDNTRPGTNKLISSNASQTCTMSNIYTRPCLPILYQIGELQIGGIVLSSLISVTWLAILVIATRDLLHKRAVEKREQRERRHKRHAKRRGHESGNGRKHRQRHGRQDRGKERKGNHSKSGNSVSRQQSPPEAREMPLLQDSNAVRYAQYTTRPNDTIQEWMANRYR